MKKLRHKILSIILSVALLATMTLTNQGLFGFNFNVSAEEPIPYYIDLILPDSVTVEFRKGTDIITTVLPGENIKMTISPNAGYYLNTLTADSFNISGGTKGTYENNVLNITNVTGDVTVTLANGVTPATLEEYDGTKLPFTGTVVMTNENITVDANLVTWANKSSGLDDTVSYGDTVIIPVYTTCYIISGTPTITINGGTPITGAYSNDNVTFTMPDIGDNNAEINKIEITDLTASPKGYTKFFDNGAMKIYSNVPAPTDGMVDLTGLTAETDGDFEMKGDTGYYAEIIPPAPNATYKVEPKLLGYEGSDGSWSYDTDQQTITLINDASGKTTGIYFKVTPQCLDIYDMLSLKITLTDVVIPSSEKAITSFQLAGKNGTIDEANHTIAFTVPYGTDIKSLTPTIAVSQKATVSPASGVAQNFTNPVEYTVTAQDDSTHKYTVTVTVAPATQSQDSTPTPTSERTVPEQIKDKLDDTSAKPIEIAKTSNSEFKEIKAEAVISKATNTQKEALKNMTAEQIQAEIKKAADAISTVNTTKISDKAKEKIISEMRKPTSYEAKFMPINFTAHATFAFPVQVTIPVDKADYPAGTYHLYYYNEETGKLEDCGEVTVDANGVATFTISHCSDYFISSWNMNLSGTPLAPVTTPAPIKNPKTGESNAARPLIIIAILSVVTLAVVSKKRKFKVVRKG